MPVPLFVVIETPPLLVPTTLSLSMFCRNYTGTSDWNGTASAGASGDGSHDLVDPGNQPGNATLNGFGTADFNGTSQFFNTDGNFASYGSSIAFSFWALVNFDVVTGTKTLLQEGSSSVEIYNFGGTLGFDINGGDESVGLAGLTTATWTLVTARYDGTTIGVGINGPPTGSTTAYGDTLLTMGTTRIGTMAGGSNYFDGKMAEIGMANTALSDGTFTSLKGYINARYGLSL